MRFDTNITIGDVKFKTICNILKSQFHTAFYPAPYQNILRLPGCPYVLFLHAVIFTQHKKMIL